MKTERPIIKSYKGYNNTNYDNICVAMCFFNPLNYQNSLENIKILINEFKKTNIPYFIIELLYPNQYSSIPEPVHIVRGKSFYFSKENLWNILETYIPDKYEKIIFLDADILCSDPDWIDKIAEKLNTKKVVHGSEYLYKNIYQNNIYEKVNINTTNCLTSVVKAILNDSNLNFGLFHPGFNISIDRNFFHKINGLFDQSVITNGDSLFWATFVPHYRFYAGTFFSAPNFKKEREEYIKYKNNILSLCNPKTDIDYVENNCFLHLYHGSIQNRKYGEQYRYIPGPYKLYKNSYGVLEIEINHPFIKDMQSYFIARKEDDNV